MVDLQCPQSNLGMGGDLGWEESSGMCPLSVLLQCTKDTLQINYGKKEVQYRTCRTSEISRFPI